MRGGAPEGERVSAVFEREITAQASDEDTFGHVSNVSYVRWVQDVALAHSERVGWDLERYRQLGAVFLVRRHELDYLRPVHAREHIVLRTWIERWTAATSVRRTCMVRTTDRTELLRATTTWALVGRPDGRPRRIPAEVREAFIER
jgi:acyl-CoA thioester hydrolase